jgi:hypothetical protein
MVKLKRIQLTLAFMIFTSLIFSSGLNVFADRKTQSDDISLSSGVSSFPVESVAATGGAASVAENSTYYTLKPDRRKCMSPMCGGYFVKRVNLSKTRCANGGSEDECYVSEIDWNGQPQVEPGRALLRGTMTVRADKRFGKLGTLKVTESWQAATENKPAGDFYRVRDRGLRCITFPCPTHLEAKLNANASRTVAGVDLSGAQATDTATSDAFMAMTSKDGILAAGSHERVTGPGGRSETLKASQFYLRSKPAQATNPKPGKPCVRTGCSGQVCADHNVITTCIYRAEYACYQKAKCERQVDGNCGFTKTPELTACLANK